MDKRVAVTAFQALLILNGAEIDDAEQFGLFGYEPRNIFRSTDGSQLSFH